MSEPSSSRKRTFDEIEESGSQEPCPDSCCHVFETELRGARHHNTEKLLVGHELHCIREPANQADHNAIALHHTTDEGVNKVGYLCRELAHILAPSIDNTQVSIKAIVNSKTNATQFTILVELRGNGLDELISEATNASNSTEKGVFTNHVLCQNLSFILETVLLQNTHLLHKSEAELYRQLQTLSRTSVTILLRLYLRQGPWFRVRRLEYFDMQLLKTHIQKLISSHLLETNMTDGIIATMTVEEMKTFLKEQRLNDKRVRVSGSKQRLTEEMKKLLQNKPHLMEELHLRIGDCVRLHPELRDALQVAEKLYFLDESRDLSSFLTAELDLVRWPSYQIKIRRHVFPDRQSFDDYFTSIDQLAKLDEWTKLNDHKSIEELLDAVWSRLESGEHKKLRWNCNGSINTLPNPIHAEDDSIERPLFLARYTSIWITVKMATMGVAYLEKKKDYNLATEKLRSLLGGNCCPFSRGHWWSRLILDLEHMKKFNAALEACSCALSDDWVRHGNRHSIKRHYLKLSKPPRRWKRPSWASEIDKPVKVVRIQASPLERVRGLKSQFQGKTGVVSVEQLALEYYQDQGDWKGIHTEGTLWTTLFGILFWDVIFSDLEDVFRSPFQNSPLDFATDSFFDSRQKLIEKRIEDIENDQFLNSFVEVWNRENGVLCVGVRWDGYQYQDLLEMIECIGSTKLAAICRLFAEDYKSIRGGLPDLFLWNVDRKECKLSEVKGLRDSLSDKQKSWIGLLTSMGFTVEVLKVDDKR